MGFPQQSTQSNVKYCRTSRKTYNTNIRIYRRGGKDSYTIDEVIEKLKLLKNKKQLSLEVRRPTLAKVVRAKKISSNGTTLCVSTTHKLLQEFKFTMYKTRIFFRSGCNSFGVLMRRTLAFTVSRHIFVNNTVATGKKGKMNSFLLLLIPDNRKQSKHFSTNAEEFEPLDDQCLTILG